MTFVSSLCELNLPTSGEREDSGRRGLSQSENDGGKVAGKVEERLLREEKDVEETVTTAFKKMFSPRSHTKKTRRMNKVFQDELNQQPILLILKTIPFILFWFSSCPLRVPSWEECLFS